MRKNAKNCCFLNVFFTYCIQKYLIFAPEFRKVWFTYGESIRFGMIWFTIISLGLVVLG